MNVPLLTMPKHDARVAFEEYREAVRARHTEEDAAIMRGYQAMAQGKPVVDVSEAIKEAGLDELGRPRLAICRADAHYCWFDHHHYLNGTAQPIFSADELLRRHRRRCYVALPRGTFGQNPQFHPSIRFRGIRAVVPSIPPRLRPRSALSHYHILWEAEWETVPRDPYLLRHLYGHLYAVLAEWDLTELERAVLKGVRP